MIAPERVVELARKLEPDGVPAYVYDLTALDAHAAAIRAALPRGVQFYYAVKANPDTAVLRTLAQHADGFEVSSGGELAHTAAAAPGRPLAFGGPGKTPAELAAALELAAAPGGGTTRFHVESPHELALLDQAARAAGRRVDVLLRVNLPGQDEQAALVMGGKPSPFGMDCELLRRCAGSLTPAVRLRGLHAHLASGVGADGLLAAAGRLVSFGRQWCAGHGVTEPEFNLGGGMAVDYTRPDGVFDWPGYGRGLAGLARLRTGAGRPGPARRDAADRAGPRRHRLLRLVPDPGARREAQPRRGVRRGRGRYAPSAHARGQGARPAVRGRRGGRLGAAVAAAWRSR